MLAIVLLALNLRFLFGSNSTFLASIREDYQLSSGSAALLTAGPVVCLGLFGPLAPRLVRRWSVMTVLTGCLLLIAAGSALRGVSAWSALLVGSLAAGAGIAVANVLAPVAIRILFPHRLGLITGIFTALVCSSAGIASGVSIPLAEDVFGHWQTAMESWALPAVLAAVAVGTVSVLLSRSSRRHPEAPASSEPSEVPLPVGPSTSLLRTVMSSPVAWAVTGFMGLQSFVAYSLMGWMPTLFRDAGLSAQQAGLQLTLLSVVSVLTALLTPVFATKLRSQSLLAVLVVLPTVLGLFGLLFASTSFPFLWAVLLGLGQGCNLSLALTMINLRAGSTAVATSLSTLAQSIGYLIAATGPIMLGVLNESTGGWEVPLGLLLVSLIPLAVCGWVAGRPVQIMAE